MRPDIQEIVVGTTGHRHVKAEGDKFLTIDCPACHDYLADEGAVESLVNVPKTYDEQQDVERAKQEGQAALQNSMEAFYKAAQEQRINPAATSATPGFAELKAALLADPEVRAALLASVAKADA